MSHFHTNVRSFGNAKFQTALTIDALHKVVPSAFAIEKHDSRSMRYAYIPTSEIIARLVREGFAPFTAIQASTRIPGKGDFTKHMIRFRHADSKSINGAYPEVILVNSHDGSSSYKLIAGIFRMICSNGLISGDASSEISVHHKGDIIHNVIDGSFEIVGQSSRALQVSEDWSRLQLTSGEQHAFASAAHGMRFANSEGEVSTPITPAQLLRPRRSEDAAPYSQTGRVDRDVPASDLWRTLNVVQENVIRGGLHGVQHSTDERGRRTRRNVTTREVKGIDQDVKLNRALWTLAQKMAELKSASAVA